MTSDSNIKNKISRSLFSSENKLVAQMAVVLAQPKKELRSISFEVPSSNGIADIVVAQLSKKAIARDHDLSIVTPRWGYALYSLPYRRYFSTNALSDLAGVNISTARLMVRNFEAAGFCKENKSRKLWIKNHQPTIPATKITAYEAKLRDWPRALQQANRYFAYADYAFVILDRKNIKPAIKNIQLFKKYGIGLISIDPNEGMHVIQNGKANGPKSPWSRWEISVEMLKCRLQPTL
jgi:hypothetical protein